MTAVERFSRLHQAGQIEAPAQRYRQLLPATPPGPGEQYAFEVDLDLCSGCKACVSACHSLNGLDDEEAWRGVGLLVGQVKKRSGWRAEPAGLIQHLTSSCHHCVDPACMNGCPVLAYDKDPVTGIVRHLDDQCIGCQYCVLKCPYDAPKYNARLGVVRKCDMCAGRLAASEAPACAQACPNEAIRITKVDRAWVTLEFRQGAPGWIAGAHPGDYTLPTTRYVSKALPRGNGSETIRMVAADCATLRVQPAHWPLVFMLVLSQAAVGLACASAAGLTESSVLKLALPMFMLSLAASTCHLGRPLGAWRAFLGLRRSWLSREIIAFSIVLPLMALGFWWKVAAGFAALTGLAAVFCSVMIYHDTRRQLWNFARSGPLFFGTMVVLGAAGALIFQPGSAVLQAVLVLGTLGKVAVEAFLLRDGRRTPEVLARSGALIRSALQKVAWARLICALPGGILMPVLSHMHSSLSAASWAAAIGFVLLLVGELLERSLFFRATDAPKMPGGINA